MIPQIKSDIKKINDHRIVRINTIYAVCFTYIAIFALNIFSYYGQIESGESVGYNSNFFIYSVTMTGVLCLLAAFILPVILSFYNKRQEKIYRLDIKNNNDKAY